jgi:hypothetical protein
MNIQTVRRIVSSALAGLLLAGSALAGNGALLGLTVGFPTINFTAAPAGATYNGSSLVINGIPVFLTFTSSGIPEFISGGTLAITANINSSGVISGGTFTISGSVTNSATSTVYSGVLLSGTVEDYGIIDLGGAGGTDLADFKLKALGGTVLGLVGGANAQVNATVTLEGSGFAGSFASNWSATGPKGDVGPPPSGKTPFDCYSVSKIQTKNKPGTASDEIKITKAGVRLDPPNTVNLATDMVQIRIDGYTVNIPAGSFVTIGTNDYKYQTGTGVVPKVTVRLNLAKGEWEFSCKGCDVGLLTFADGIDVCLMIGSFESCTNVPAGGGSSHSSDNSSDDATGPVASCKLPSSAGSSGSSGSSDSSTPGPNKMSPISSITIEHISGKRLTRSRVHGTLLHPTTVFANSAISPDKATLDTSGGTCLRCGDPDSSGKFTIVRISGTPGDKLSKKCGVPDASCTIPLP